MHLGFISRRSGRRWWWAFALLIAAPALALALLGLRVAQLEGLERAQQTREQQAQFARLADSTVGTMLGARCKASCCELRAHQQRLGSTSFLL